MSFLALSKKDVPDKYTDNLNFVAHPLDCQTIAFPLSLDHMEKFMREILLSLLIRQGRKTAISDMPSPL